MVDLFLQKGVFSLGGDVDDRGLNALHWAIHEGPEAIIVKLQTKEQLYRFLRKAAMLRSIP
jgi:hypothetical protein